MALYCCIVHILAWSIVVHYINITYMSVCAQIDQRYLVLECVEEEREAVLRDYLYELHRKGPPPPPTATNPSDRLKRIP